MSRVNARVPPVCLSVCLHIPAGVGLRLESNTAIFAQPSNGQMTFGKVIL